MGLLSGLKGLNFGKLAQGLGAAQKFGGGDFLGGAMMGLGGKDMTPFGYRGGLLSMFGNKKDDEDEDEEFERILELIRQNERRGG